MKKQYLCILLICFICLVSCTKNSENQKGKTVKFNVLNEKRIEISEKISEGFPIGIDFDHNCAFIKSVIKEKRCFSISIINIESLEVLKRVALPAGDCHSPTEYFSPVYIEMIDNRYYVADQFEKIVVYDAQFNHLYSSMYHQLRFFIDIFSYKKIPYFLIGTTDYFRKIDCLVKVYKIQENKKPIETTIISPKIEIQNIYNTNVGNSYNNGYFWPSLHGFEKDGKLYYAIGDKKEIYVYDLGQGKIHEYALSYLEPKKFTNEEAIKFGFKNSDGREERYFKQFGEKYIYSSYQEQMYHFGIYDVGVDRIGIVADLNLENLIFRLDIIDINLWEYKESIWLPIGFGFKKTLSTEFRGLTKGYINIDRGIYIHGDLIGPDFREVTRITNFTKK